MELRQAGVAYVEAREAALVQVGRARAARGSKLIMRIASRREEPDARCGWQQAVSDGHHHFAG